MREHGVIRRALLVCAETVSKLRQRASSVDAAALRQTAQLFRTFGEDYHEKLLEEQHIFPIVRKQGAELQRYADILTAQHSRGREITDYVLAVTHGREISSAHAEPLAGIFEGFVRMYENHAAREDTIVFPAWKKNFSEKQLDEFSEQFEDIEHKMFGKDDLEFLGVNRPGFRRMASGTATLPISWIIPARRKAITWSSGRRIRSPNRAQNPEVQEVLRTRLA